MSNLDFPLMSYNINNSQHFGQINNNALVQMVLWLLKKNWLLEVNTAQKQLEILASPGFVSSCVVGPRAAVDRFALGRFGASGTGNGGTARRCGAEGRGTLWAAGCEPRRDRHGGSPEIDETTTLGQRRAEVDLLASAGLHTPCVETTTDAAGTATRGSGSTRQVASAGHVRASEAPETWTCSRALAFSSLRPWRLLAAAEKETRRR
jgi:hypothetical protein